MILIGFRVHHEEVIGTYICISCLSLFLKILKYIVITLQNDKFLLILEKLTVYL